VPIIVVILLIGGCLLFGNSTKSKGPPVGEAIAVSAAPVRTGNIDIILNALGIVTPVYTVTVTSRVTGEITEVLYQEGQMVKKNDLLLVIDPRPYAAAVTQAEGQLKRDEAVLENAQLDLARYQDAVQTHAIPEQQMATQQALVLEDQGTVQLDQGNLEAANVNLDYTHIRSPIDGQVGLRLVDPGNIVAAAGTTPLVVITQLQPITVIFAVAEDNLGEITPELHSGHPLRVDALDRAQQAKIAEGALITLDNQIGTATGTVRARAAFANTKNELFPNQFVNAKLYVKTLTQVTLVPTAAIQRNDTAAFVYVIQPSGTVKSRPVKLTASEGDEAAVTGVQSGETLVTDGFEKLQDGSKVAVRKPGDKNPQPDGS
jgi:multidrug efflux system membrane fusion protein